MPPWLYWSVVAVVFTAAYFPVVNALTKGLVSPYPKADLRRRFQAAALDAALVTTAGVLFQVSGSPSLPVAAAIYLVFRDGLGGRSVGKLVCGLMVVSLETGRPATLMQSLRRNLLFL